MHFNLSLFYHICRISTNHTPHTMKRITILVTSLCFAIPAISLGQELRKLAENEADQEKVAFAEKFATEYFEALKSGANYLFENEATNEVKNQLTPEYQNTIYNQLKTNLGNFVSLEYAETWMQTEGQDLNIIRFKSVFDNTDQQIEVRVVLNKAGKISGFFITPWRDSLD